MPATLASVIRAYRQIASSKDEDAQLAMRSLLENVSYRLPANAAKDPLIGPKVFGRCEAPLKSTNPSYSVISRGGNSAIIEMTMKFEDLEVEYVQRQTKQKVGLYIDKSAIVNQIEGGAGQLNLGRLTAFAIPLFFRCLFSRRRANRAMTIRYILELTALLQVLQKYKITRVYDFAPYEVDSNLMYLLLKKEGIQHIKLPSPGPLKTHNHMLLADKMILSSQYQFEEVETLPEVKVKTIEKWVPEYAFTYIDQYAKEPQTTELKTIGFYSHGGWLRREEGHADDGLNIPEAEEALLTDLAQFVKKNPDYRVKVFAHPREKTEENFEQAKAFYKGFFGEREITFSDANKKTSASFADSDIGLAAFSTILYERMFCGFKTLIGNYGFAEFPMEGSTLQSICFDSYDKLEKLIQGASDQSADDFFTENELQGYRYFEYPYFSKRK